MDLYIDDAMGMREIGNMNQIFLSFFPYFIFHLWQIYNTFGIESTMFIIILPYKVWELISIGGI